MHTFSVVIATRNREALLAVTLDALAAQDWPRDRMEVIVADNGSTDGTAAVVAEAGRSHRAAPVRYVWVEQPGKSPAVNQALSMASGDLIALTDDDVRPEPDWLRRLAAAFDETAADFVAGRIRPIWEAPPPDFVSPAVYGVLAIPENGNRRLPLTVDAQAVVPIGANMAVRRSVIEAVGGLHTDLGKLEGSLRTGEDHEFFLRMLHAGFAGVYEPTALVHHRVGPERLYRGYFRRWLYQNGRDVARLDRAYPPTGVAWLLRAPRYRWRQALQDGFATLHAALRGDRAGRFGAATRLFWFAGYLRQRWFGRPEPLRASGEQVRTSRVASQAG